MKINLNLNVYTIYYTPINSKQVTEFGKNSIVIQESKF